LSLEFDEAASEELEDTETETSSTAADGGRQLTHHPKRGRSCCASPHRAGRNRDVPHGDPKKKTDEETVTKKIAKSKKTAPLKPESTEPELEAAPEAENKIEDPIGDETDGEAKIALKQIYGKAQSGSCQLFRRPRIEGPKTPRKKPGKN
jgi:hypothetical protein